MALGITGAEGEPDDDWLVVDCFNCAVHFMLPGILDDNICHSRSKNSFLFPLIHIAFYTAVG